MIFCKICRPLLAAIRIFRRISVSSALAVSAMVSSSRMAPWMRSSRYLLVCRALKNRSMAVASPLRSASYS